VDGSSINAKSVIFLPYEFVARTASTGKDLFRLAKRVLLTREWEKGVPIGSPNLPLLLRCIAPNSTLNAGLRLECHGIDSEDVKHNEKAKSSPMTLVTLSTLLLAGSFGKTGAEARLAKSEETSLAVTYTDHAAIWIDGDADCLAQAAAESWEGDGTSENPIIIAGYRITDSGTQCIRLWNVDLFWIVRNCLLEGGPPYICGLWSSNVSNGQFKDNIVRDRHSGILAYDGTENVNFTGNEIYDNKANAFEGQGGMVNCSISNNEIHDNFGVNLWITGGYTNCEISDNTISGGTYGLNSAGGVQSVVEGNKIADTSLDALMVLSSTDVTLAGNMISDSGGEGILVSGGNLRIDSNVITNTSGRGIRVATGDFTVVQNNSISEARDYGLALSATTGNLTVTRNSFISNGDGCQVEDAGEDNHFYFNHYSDWTTPDSNSDNVVDNPYLLDGDASNQDAYPLVDAHGPVISTTTTGTDTTSTTGSANGSLDLVPIVAAGAVVILLVVVLVVKRSR
jgi:hypothetical protein